MKKQIFYTQFNPPPRIYEKNDGSSQTELDPGMSVKEMVKKYVLDGGVFPENDDYDDNEENLVPQDIDLSDLHNANVLVGKAKDVAAKKKSKGEGKPSGSASKDGKGNGEATDDKGGTTAKEGAGAVPPPSQPDGSPEPGSDD